jgi:UPF0755 protein
MFYNFSLQVRVAIVFSILFVILLPPLTYEILFSPSDRTAGMDIVDIAPGTGTRGIGKILYESDIIGSRFGFLLWAKVSGNATKLKAGEYALSASWPVPKIMEKIASGKIIIHNVTIPEGFNMKEAARAFSRSGVIDYDSFIASASDPEILEKFGIRGKNAEGYLYPETYSFPKSATSREVVVRMISTFFERVDPVKKKFQKKARLTFSQIVTLASIIEKETANSDEYGLVSAVYDNRLRQKIMLQADPTVIYGLPDYDGDIKKEDLKYDSPYNTYVHWGLPPGPIANPSVNAIIGAYNPADVDYIYFVATKKDGRHFFSNNYDDHRRAVRKYQLGRRR